MRLKDLRTGGRLLAERLGEQPPGSLVVGIVRGGVPAAAEVAARLRLPLDLLLIRRLRMAADGEARCAVCAAGTLVLDEDPRDDPDPVYHRYGADAVRELVRRGDHCRGGRGPRALNGTRILLVDNGIHTGGTARAAIRALRRLGAGRIVAAVPVCSPDARGAIAGAADELVCLEYPAPFGHVGLWYRDYSVPSLEEVAAAGIRD